MSTSTNTLYLIRHGENLANITKEFSYKKIDYSLTPKGVIQAEQTSDYFKNIHLDAIYASPLKRAYETAEIIARPHHLPVEIIEEFREINVGHLEDMPPTVETWKLYMDVFQDWAHGHPERSYPGGENFLELIARARRGLLLATQGRNNEHILIAAHGGIFVALVSYFCQSSSAGTDYAMIHNCSITEVELTTSGEEVQGTLRCWGSTDHLSGEAAALVLPMPEISETV